MNIRHLYYTSSESFLCSFKEYIAFLSWQQLSPWLSKSVSHNFESTNNQWSPSGPHPVPIRSQCARPAPLPWNCRVMAVYHWEPRPSSVTGGRCCRVFFWKIMHIISIYIYTIVWYSHNIVKSYTPSISQYFWDKDPFNYQLVWASLGYQGFNPQPVW